MMTTRSKKHTEEIAVSYCEHCGFAIYDTKDSVRVRATGDLIHKECWSEYSSEHMFDFVENEEESWGYDRSDSYGSYSKTN